MILKLRRAIGLGSRNVGVAFVLAALMIALGLATAVAQRPAGGAVTLAQYEGLQDQLGQAQVTGLVVSWAAGMAFVGAHGYLFSEVWRMNAITFLSTLDMQVKDAMAVALTTNTVKDYRIMAEAEVESARLILEKLKHDLKFYEEKYSQFASAGDNYSPTNRGERADWEHYKAIKDALQEYKYTRDNVTTGQREDITLKDAEKTLNEQAEAFRSGLMEMMNRLNKVKYGIGAVKTDSAFIRVRLEPLRDTLFGISVMAEQLSGVGHTPKNELRAIFTNSSKDLVFFIQVQSPGPDGSTYTVRRDTFYPFPIYPDVSGASDDEKSKLQIQPITPAGRNRGHTEFVLPIAPREKVVIRVATMGQVRDRIHFMPLNGKAVSPDLNSLSRGFYYLGYQAELPQGTLISQWYPVEESYTWRFFKGEWQDGPASSRQLSSTPGRTLRGWGPPLTVSQDRFEWTMPTSRDIAAGLGETSAEVTGSVKFLKIGPSAILQQKQEITEDCKGTFTMLIQAW